MIALEFFGCSGGMADGFHRAGITFDFAFDADPDACDSYAANLGHRPIQMDVRDLLRLVRAGWRPTLAPLDLIVADPPCTPWSPAGKRLGEADERDLLAETVDLIRLLRPRAYLLGNVPGLQFADAWPTVQARLGELARVGYCVADWITLDAADYGVPQHRRRPFWFGHRGGSCIRWPTPTHGDPRNLGLPGIEMLPWVTCRAALSDLSAEDLGRPVRIRIRETGEDWRKNGGDRTRCSRPDAPAPTVGAKDRWQGTVLLGPDRDHHPNSRPGHPSRTIKPNTGRNGSGAALLAWPWDVPATTVSTDERIPPPGTHPRESSILSVPNAVVLSERAAARLQGFPDSWKFCGKTKRSRWSQLGQAMPPPMAEAVARSVAAQFAATEIAARAAE